MSAGNDPANDSPPPHPARRHGPHSLLSWYYSSTGTLIRVALYITAISLLVAWRMGWIWQPAPQPGQQQTLDQLQVVGWAKKRWQSPVPDNLPIGQLPYVEVTVAEPDRNRRGYSLQELADGLHLFTASEPHNMLSWPIGAAGGSVGDADADATPDATPGAVDEAVQPRAFNDQWIVSFLIRPDQVPTLPDTLWLVYLDPHASAPAGAAPQLKLLAILTPAQLKATEPPKKTTAPAAPAAPVAPDAPSTPLN
jgi:hypothetical protein